MKHFIALLSLPAFFFVAGCSINAVKNFADVQPSFQPEQFFSGHVEAWGVIEDSSGDPTKRFNSTDEGDLQKDTVTISQTIAFSDGTNQKRSWKLKRVDEHHYEGTADDIVGVARGELYGNALNLDYTVALSRSNPFTHIHLNQWLYLQKGGNDLISRTTISKLGIVVARIAEYVHREPKQSTHQ